MRNFRVVRIDAITGEVRLLYDFVSEDFAWSKVEELEELEIDRPFRRAWYAVTNLADWQRLARQFLDYRKQLVIP